MPDFVCPVCHTELIHLYCPKCEYKYYKEDGVTCLLPPKIDEYSSYYFEIQRYNEIAKDGPEKYSGLEETRPFSRAMLVNDFLLENKIKEFLNIGIGFGFIENALHYTINKCISYDPCIEFIKYVKERHPSNKHTYVNGIAEALPFPDKSIGCVVCDSAFQSINNRMSFLYEVGRVTRDKALILISIGYLWNYPRKPQDGFNINNLEELKTLRRFLKELGFKIQIRYRDSNNNVWVDKKSEGDYLWIIGKKEAL